MDESKKVKLNIIFKIILIVSLAIFFACAGLYSYYYFTKENVENYIDKNYECYIKIHSLADLYNNLVDLKAADVILSQGSLKNIYKILLDIRSSRLATNKAMTSLLNMRASVFIKKDYSPVLAIDMGLKSLLLRAGNLNPALLVKLLGNQKIFSIAIIKKEKYNIFRVTFNKSGQTFFLSVFKNLLFISLYSNDIDYVYGIKKTGAGIADDPSFFLIKNKIKSGGMVDIYFNTRDMLNAFTSNLPDIRKIFSKLNFNNNSAISFDISNEKISLNSFTGCSSNDKLVEKFLTDFPSKPGIAGYLPLETSFCTSLNFDSFEELYKLFLYIEQGKYETTIDKIDNSSQVLFKMGIKDLLFSWIGREIGAFYAADSYDPVVFIKIRDRNRLNDIIKKLFESAAFDQGKTLVYDDVELNKIKFPDFIQTVIASFLERYIDAPYYIIRDDYIFFSMDPAPLANMVRKKDHGLVLSKDHFYQNIAAKVDGSSNIYLYFNSSQILPVFLQNESMFASLLRLYEKGVMSININQSRLKIDISAAGMNVKKPVVYPGYPKKFKQNISSNIVCSNITGSSVDELVFKTDDNKLIAADINLNTVNNFPVKFDGKCEGDPIVADLDKDGLNEIYLYEKTGSLYKFDAFGNLIPGYPVNTGCKNSFNPVIFNGNLLLYSKAKNKLVLIDDKRQKKELDFEFKNTLHSPPAVFENILACYPKNMAGTIYVINSNGKLLTGWPRDASGVGFGSPLIADIKQNGINCILFVTQSGKLNAWKFDGSVMNNFPVQLEGIYYCQPVSGDVGKGGCIITLNKEGLVTLVSPDGGIIAKKQIKDADSKDRKIILYDINSDGKKEIIIYGGRDNIIALDGNLNLIPGFPLRGITKPDFTDFNSDGETEMVTSAIDGSIYIYSIPKK